MEIRSHLEGYLFSKYFEWLLCFTPKSKIDLLNLILKGAGKCLRGVSKKNSSFKSKKLSEWMTRRHQGNQGWERKKIWPMSTVNCWPIIKCMICILDFFICLNSMSLWQSGFGLSVCLLPLYSFYLMFVIRAVDRLALVFSGYWGMYQATHKVVFMLGSCISMDWGSTLKKGKNDTRKDDLIFPGKIKSAKVIYLYRDARVFSSSERAYSPHSLFAFRHNLSTHEHFFERLVPCMG